MAETPYLSYTATPTAKNTANFTAKLDCSIILIQTISQMPKIKPLQSDQLLINELLPDVQTTPYKPIRKHYKAEPLYRSKKPRSAQQLE